MQDFVLSDPHRDFSTGVVIGQQKPTTSWLRGFRVQLWQLHRSMLICTCGLYGPQAWINGWFSQFTARSHCLAVWRSLQHDIFEVFLQDGVLDSVKDKTDIFCVYSSGEVVEEWLAPVSPLTAERLHQKCLEGTERLQYFIWISFLKHHLYEKPCCSKLGEGD